jgi:hypothetical protein
MCLKSARRSSSKCWLRSCSVSVIDTLVNRGTTSKLTIRSSGCTLKESNVCTNWREFLTCVDYPVSWLRRPARYFDSWEVVAPMLLTVGLIGTPSLCIFGNPYNLGGLEPDRSRCL